MNSCRLQLLPIRCALLTVLLLLTVHCSLVTGYAQSATATLSGTVTDANTAVVPGAHVTAMNESTGMKREATTNGSGTFTIPLLPPSTYTVLVESQGFTPAEIKDVVINVGDNVALNIQLKVGQMGASVDVRSDSSVTKESAEVSTVVDRQFVGNLPLNGRSFQSLIALTPGVVVTKTNSNTPGQFSVNGQRTNSNYFTVDGVSANFAGSTRGQSAGGELPALSVTGGTNNLVSVDAVQEFRIQTSTYAAEFGRTPGAQVQIVTRSGGNRFSGTVFEYFRNDALDANDWFANSRRLRRPPLRQNDFGGVFGGPIFKNRTFFFFSYEGLRLRQPLVRITEVPSLTSRQAASIQMRPYINAFPLPTGGLTANGFAEAAASFSNPTFLNATSLRIDHTSNGRVTLFGRFNYAPSGTDERAPGNRSLSTVNKQRFKTQTLTIGTTQILNTNINNESRFNYSQDRPIVTSMIDSFGGAVIPSASDFIPSSLGSPDDSIFSLNIDGGVNSSLFLGTQRKVVQRQINITDNLSVLTGSHQLKFGVDYRRLTPHYFAQRYVQLVNFNNVNVALTGNASFLSVGTIDDVTLLFNNLSLFAQDTWRSSRRLALTYGVRWEINPAPKVRSGPAPVIVQGASNPTTASLAPAGTPFYKTRYNNFAPRIGVSYQLLQNPGRELILRGGLGIFYDLGYGSLGEIPGTFPYQRSLNLAGVPYPSQAAPPSLNLNPPFTSQILTFDENIKLPYTTQWNLALEQSLGAKQTVSVSYIGAAGRRLLRRVLVSGFPVPTFRTLFITKGDASSDYNALQTQYQRRLARGLQALASYSWSHSTDTGSDDSGLGSLERGDSSFDVRNSFSAAVSYDIPAPRIGKAGRAVLGHWSIDTLLTARSATPVDLSSGFLSVFNGFNFANQRPNLIPGVPLYITDPTFAGGKRFNRAAFSVPPANQQGTFPRNGIRGFGAWQVDLALRRQFNLTERINLQLRAEAFNVFNHPNFADPVGALGSGLFGQSTQMLGKSLGSGGASGGFNPLYQLGGPRSIQFALKLQF